MAPDDFKHQKIICYLCSPPTHQVFVGPGSKELIYHLLYLMEGDLLLPAPSWVSYGPQAQLVGKRVKSVSSIAEEGYRITAESLERACEYDEVRR